jgi:putative DNA primase/helicase
VQVNRPHMVETLTRAARFLRYNARSKRFVPIDAPEKVADAYLARHGAWKLPIIAGIASAPFLRPDGSLCDQPGYDPQSCVLYRPEETFPTIPQQPSKSDAVEALGLIEKLIETFPFVSPADKAVTLAAIFTALDRRAMPTAPLHAYTAPSAGTGKSLLVDAIAMLATGRLMPVIAQGRSEEEFEKRLGAALLAGDAVISIDNCDHEVSSALLCQALTQQHLNIRILGFSKNVETPVNAAIFATGNNLTIAGDLTRRTLLCALDARCERPELRTFDIDVLETIRANRGALVAAVLTVLRAWHVARRNERIVLPAFGSFQEWSRRIREPLVWLGHADPCETITKVRENDPTRIALNAVLVQWKENLGFTPHTVQQVIGAALTVSDFQAALVAVAGSRTGTMVVGDRLGRWLKKVEGRVMNGLMLTHSGGKDGYPLWQLVSVAS